MQECSSNLSMQIAYFKIYLLHKVLTWLYFTAKIFILFLFITLSYIILFNAVCIFIGFTSFALLENKESNFYL